MKLSGLTIGIPREIMPSYAGVTNPLYEREDTILLFGDAGKTLGDLMAKLHR